MGRVCRVVFCTAVLAAALPASALATLDVVTTSPTPVTAVMSSDGRFVAWTDGENSIAVRDRDTAQTETFTFSQLRPPTGDLMLPGLELYGVDDTGRYLSYRAGRGGEGAVTALVRFDRVTAAHLVLASWTLPPTFGPWGEWVSPAAVSRDARTFAWIHQTAAPTLDRTVDREARVMVRTVDANHALQIGTTCITPGLYPAPCITGPAVSGDGTMVFYTAGSTFAEALAEYDVATAQVSYRPQVRPFLPQPVWHAGQGRRRPHGEPRVHP